MSEKRQKLMIEPSKSMRTPENVYRLEMCFEKPLEYQNEGSFGPYTKYVYTVKHNGEEKQLSGFTGMHNAIESVGTTKGTVIDLFVIGTGKESRWEAEYISGPKKSAYSDSDDIPTGFEKPVNQSTGVSMQSVAPILSNEDKNTIIFLADQELDLISAAYALVQSDERFAEFNQDEMLRITHGILINAKKTWRPGMVTPSQANVISEIDEWETLFSPAEQRFLVSVNVSGNVGDFAKSLVGALASELAIMPQEATDYVLKLGIKSDELINAGDSAIVNVMRAAAKLHAGDGIDEVADEFGFNPPRTHDSPPF